MSYTSYQKRKRFRDVFGELLYPQGFIYKDKCFVTAKLDREKEESKC